MFIKVNRAGPATLTYNRHHPNKIFAVKKVKGFNKDSLSRLYLTIYLNIVWFIMAYYYKGSYFLFYDDIKTYLTDLLLSPKDNLKIKDIMTIYLKITGALAYLYNDLKICYDIIMT